MKTIDTHAVEKIQAAADASYVATHATDAAADATSYATNAAADATNAAARTDLINALEAS